MNWQVVADMPRPAVAPTLTAYSEFGQFVTMFCMGEGAGSLDEPEAVVNAGHRVAARTDVGFLG